MAEGGEGGFRGEGFSTFEIPQDCRRFLETCISLLCMKSIGGALEELVDHLIKFTQGNLPKS